MVNGVTKPFTLWLKSNLPSDRSYMRLTEKENETLPVDVSLLNTHSDQNSSNQTPSSPSRCLSADCTTDLTVLRHDLLWYRPHRWRLQRNGRVLRTEE